MQISLSRLLTCLAAAVASVSAAELEIIAKARSCLGSDEVLSSVNSVRYEGWLIAPDPATARARLRIFTACASTRSTPRESRRRP